MRIFSLQIIYRNLPKTLLDISNFLFDEKVNKSEKQTAEEDVATFQPLENLWRKSKWRILGQIWGDIWAYVQFLATLGFLSRNHISLN